MAQAVVRPPTPEPSGEGDLRDVGAVRRPQVSARSYTALGNVKVLGDLLAASAELHGLASVGGRLTGERVRAEGTLDVAGDVAVRGELTVRGTALLGGGLTAGDLVCQGRIRVAQGIVLDGHGRVHGTLEVGQGLQARAIQFDGGITVPGTLDCPTVEGRLRRPSRIGTLRSQNVRIVRPVFPPGGSATLVVDRIEATEVELEAVDCEYLRAERVRLGPGSHVTRVDGQVVRQHRSAVVGPLSREPIPPGITR